MSENPLTATVSFSLSIFDAERLVEVGKAVFLEEGMHEEDWNDWITEEGSDAVTCALRTLFSSSRVPTESGFEIIDDHAQHSGLAK